MDLLLEVLEDREALAYSHPLPPLEAEEEWVPQYIQQLLEVLEVVQQEPPSLESLEQTRLLWGQEHRELLGKDFLEEVQDQQQVVAAAARAEQE